MSLRDESRGKVLPRWVDVPLTSRVSDVLVEEAPDGDDASGVTGFVRKDTSRVDH